ncbi:MAG: hypothetical protein FJ312_08815 [SAR202 cluster bacterium]|nr:hypothetical protein [SAR202 cluster bacterium]
MTRAEEKGQLVIELAAEYLSVSSLSALLRALQAALREVAMADADVAAHFAQRPQPILVLSKVSSEGTLTLHFTFAGPKDSKPLADLSAQVFGPFMARFGEFLKALPQPSLWGTASRGKLGRRYESELERRMDEVRAHIRRFGTATLRFGGHEVRVQGEHMEIE